MFATAVEREEHGGSGVHMLASEIGNGLELTTRFVLNILIVESLQREFHLTNQVGFETWPVF